MSLTKLAGAKSGARVHPPLPLCLRLLLEVLLRLVARVQVRLGSASSLLPVPMVAVASEVMVAGACLLRLPLWVFGSRSHVPVP